MKSYEWWLKQKKRVQKKYNLLLGRYYSPKETEQFAKVLIQRRVEKGIITSENKKRRGKKNG
jgi:hypothetical protein